MNARGAFAILCVLSACLIAGCSERRNQAPDFTLSSVEDQQSQVTLSDLTREKSVLLVFWATWCPSCIEEIPILNAWQEQYAERGLQVLAVNVQEPRHHVLEFQKMMPLNYPSLLDADGEVASRYNLMALPSSVLLAKGGEILYYGFGLPERIERFFATDTKAGAPKGELIS